MDISELSSRPTNKKALKDCSHVSFCKEICLILRSGFSTSVITFLFGPQGVSGPVSKRWKNNLYNFIHRVMSSDCLSPSKLNTFDDSKIPSIIRNNLHMKLFICLIFSSIHLPDKCFENYKMIHFSPRHTTDWFGLNCYNCTVVLKAVEEDLVWQCVTISSSCNMAEWS